MNTVHGLVFDGAQVNPTSLLTYSEQSLADIHGNLFGAHCLGNLLYFGAREFITDKLREVLLLFLPERRYYLRLNMLWIRDSL